MKRKTFLALAASAMLAVLAGVTTSCTDKNDNPVDNPSAPNAEADAPAFDENNVVLAFAALSDTHIMVDPANSMQGIYDGILAAGL